MSTGRMVRPCSVCCSVTHCLLDPSPRRTHTCLPQMCDSAGPTHSSHTAGAGEQSSIRHRCTLQPCQATAQGYRFTEISLLLTWDQYILYGFGTEPRFPSSHLPLKAIVQQKMLFMQFFPHCKNSSLAKTCLVSGVNFLVLHWSYEANKY